MANPRRGDYQGDSNMRGRQDERGRDQGGERGWRTNDDRQERGGWRSGEQGFDEREEYGQSRDRDDFGDRSEGGYGYPSSRYGGQERGRSENQWQSQSRSRGDFSNEQRGMGGVNMGGGRIGHDDWNQPWNQQRVGERSGGQSRWGGRDEAFYRPSGWSGNPDQQSGQQSWGGQQYGGGQYGGGQYGGSQYGGSPSGGRQYGGNFGGEQFGSGQGGQYGSGGGQYGSGQYGGQPWSRQSGQSGGGMSGRQGQSFAGRGPKDYRRSDDRIREEISDRFTDDDHIDASEIMIQVQQGEVTLSGTVQDREQKRHAEDLAESISGVREVTNNLRVSRGQQQGLGQQAAGDESQQQQGESKTGTANKSKSATA